MTEPTEPARTGWDLVTSRPLTEEQRRRIAELAAAEGKGKAEGKPSKRRSDHDRR